MKKILLTAVLAFLGIHTATAQVGIGTTSPDASAQLELQSTTKGFLPPRMTTNNRNDIENPVEGLTIYNTDVGCLDTYNGVRWISCNTIGATDVYNPETGQIWMDRNLGASQVATSSTDNLAYGDLYQWGRAADGHQLRTSNTNSNLSTADQPGHGDFILAPNSPYDWLNTPDDNRWNTNETSGGDVTKTANDPCPLGYRVPTEAEWQAELGTGKITNAQSAFDILKLPMAGRRDAINGSPGFVGSYGFYWSSTVSNSDSRFLRFPSFSAHVDTGFRAYGCSVRCLKD